MGGGGGGGDPSAQHEEAMRLLRDDNYVHVRWTRGVWLRVGLALLPALAVGAFLWLFGR